MTHHNDDIAQLESLLAPLPWDTPGADQPPLFDFEAKRERLATLLADAEPGAEVTLTRSHVMELVGGLQRAAHLAYQLRGMERIVADARTALMGEKVSAVPYSELPEIAEQVAGTLAQITTPDDRVDYVFIHRGDGGEQFLVSWESAEREGKSCRVSGRHVLVKQEPTGEPQGSGGISSPSDGRGRQ